MILVGSDGSDSSDDALELAQHLAHVAADLSASVIVLGSGHRGADDLLRTASCFVAVAPRGYARRYANRLEHVVAAFDGPPDADGPVDLLVTDSHGYGLLASSADCPVLVVPGRR